MAEPGLVSAATLGAITRLVGDLARLGFEAWRKNRAARDKLAALLFHVQGEVDNNRRSVRAALNGSSVEWLSTAVYDVAIEALVPALVNDKTASILDPLQQARGLINWGLQERMRQFAVGEGDGVELKQLSMFFSSASYEIDRWLEAQKIGRRGIALHDCEARTERELVGGFERVEQSVILTTWHTFRNALLRGEAHEYTLRDEI